MAAPQTTAGKSAEGGKAAADAKPATEKAAPAAKPAGYTVVGAAVVLAADDGTERYLYRGAPVDDSAFSKDAITHAIAVGLIAKTK